MNQGQILQNIERAEKALATARGELDGCIRAVESAPRSQKTIITSVLDDAFGKMQAAGESLSQLRSLIPQDDT